MFLTKQGAKPFPGACFLQHMFCCQGPRGLCLAAHVFSPRFPGYVFYSACFLAKVSGAHFLQLMLSYRGPQSLFLKAQVFNPRSPGFMFYSTSFVAKVPGPYLLQHVCSAQGSRAVVFTAHMVFGTKLNNSSARSAPKTPGEASRGHEEADRGRRMLRKWRVP